MIKHLWNKIPIGTRSVLIGAHCFFLHPFFVARAWISLYGYPLDPRIWVSFFVHDFGYWGKPNIDGPEGEKHVELGAKIMSKLFDPRENFYNIRLDDGTPIGKWGQFSLYHSRHYAKANNAEPSKLCFADKLSFSYTPRWLYLPMVTLTGEINEYLENAQKSDSKHWTPTNFDKNKWHAQLSEYFIKWVQEHKNGTKDTWTKVRYL